jgi:hypothetical protein
MLHASDPRFEYCWRVKRAVRVCRPEVDCRQEYGCAGRNCPLAKSFGLKAFDERMRAFASTFDLWPLSEGKDGDFP